MDGGSRAAVSKSSAPAEARLPDPLLEVRDLSVRLGQPRSRVTAVDGVSLTLARAETLGLAGESGSGKTVLAKALMHLLPEGAEVGGEIRFAGRDLNTLPVSEMRHFWGPQVAMVFQNPLTSLNPVRRVGDHLVDTLRFHLGLDGGVALTRAVELLEMVRIPEAKRRLRQYPHELSGGMRQRVMIAIALSCRPKVLVADEPTTALDVTVQRQILDLLSELQRQLDMSVLLISHNLGVLAGHTDRIAIMYAGRIVEVARTAELFGTHRHPYTRALLAAVPRLDQPSHTRLVALSGRPPDMRRPPAGCRFAGRCPNVRDRCWVESPDLRWEAGSAHLFACHFPVEPRAGEAAS